MPRMCFMKFSIKCSICDSVIAETDDEHATPAQLAEKAGAWDITLTYTKDRKSSEGGYVCKNCYNRIFAARAEKPILKSAKCATGYHLHSRKIIKADTRYLIIEV